MSRRQSIWVFIAVMMVALALSWWGGTGGEKRARGLSLASETSRFDWNDSAGTKTIIVTGFPSALIDIRTDNTRSRYDFTRYLRKASVNLPVGNPFRDGIPAVREVEPGIHDVIPAEGTGSRYHISAPLEPVKLDLLDLAR